jgi:integrase/recombinase XerC
VDIYTRHIKAFYRWAYERGLIQEDPAVELGVPHIGHAKPHPTRLEDLTVIFACTSGPLRDAYLLAAFAGLRCGEICRLQGQDLDLTEPATALVHGKGGKDRTIPLLPAVVAELRAAPRRGWLVTLENGKPYQPKRLSSDSSRHLHELGLATTLAFQATRDPLFVRDLLGHESVATTEVYTASSLADAHQRLSGLSDQAASMLRPRHLAAVR